VGDVTTTVLMRSDGQNGDKEEGRNREGKDAKGTLPAKEEPD
jgi:hypothetical protein